MPPRPQATSDEKNRVPFYKKPTVVVNMAAGSSSDITEEVTTIFRRFNSPCLRIHLVEPSELSQTLSSVKNDDTDLLVIYGGDGTCKSGAVAARDAGIPLVALPGGTMNMLPKALYGTDSWQLALELALSQIAPRWQVAGNINDQTFFCGALLGDPIVMSEAREAFRDGEVIDAVKQLPDIMTAISHGDCFEYKIDEETFHTQVNGLQIYCPHMTTGATDPKAFELASVEHLSMAQMIGIGAKALTQDWRDSVNVKTAFAQSIEIAGPGTFDILLDGEIEQIKCPMKIKLEQKGVLVLAPNLHEAAQL